MTDSPPRPRLTLSLRLSDAPADREAEFRILILQALNQGLCLRWHYNRVAMRVAPQILYSDKDALFVDAVVLEKAGVVPPDIKLGRFKLGGLSGVALTSEPLLPVLAIDLADPRYAEQILAHAAL